VFDDESDIDDVHRYGAFHRFFLYLYRHRRERSGYFDGVGSFKFSAHCTCPVTANGSDRDGGFDFERISDMGCGKQRWITDHWLHSDLFWRPDVFDDESDIDDVHRYGAFDRFFLYLYRHRRERSGYIVAVDPLSNIGVEHGDRCWFDERNVGGLWQWGVYCPR
jgi:hypothetical protein